MKINVLIKALKPWTLNEKMNGFNKHNKMCVLKLVEFRVCVFMTDLKPIRSLDTHLY